MVFVEFYAWEYFRDIFNVAYVVWNVIGEVMVWDVGNADNMLVATSGIGDDSHSEPVSKLVWIRDTGSKGGKYNVSVSTYRI